MVNPLEISHQLDKIGINFRFFGKPELRELHRILIPSEMIEHCLIGRYDGGFAVLCATDLRVLLVDKKPFFLFLEDIRYDMVAEVDYGQKVFDATIRISTPSKTLRFTGFGAAKVRATVGYIQSKVLDYSQRQAGQAQHEIPAPNALPAPPTPVIATSVVDDNIATVIGKTDFVEMSLPLVSVPRAVNRYVSPTVFMRRRT